MPIFASTVQFFFAFQSWLLRNIRVTAMSIPMLNWNFRTVLFKVLAVAHPSYATHMWP